MIPVQDDFEVGESKYSRDHVLDAAGAIGKNDNLVV